MSLEEAKTLTVQLPTPEPMPPRRIDDVLSVLDGAKPDEAKINALRERALAAPPAGASTAVLARFYFERSIAADNLGLYNERLVDLREAVKNGVEAGLNYRDLRSMLRSLFSAERTNGNLVAARDAAQQALRIQAGSVATRLLIERYHADVGETEEAKTYRDYIGRFESTNGADGDPTAPWVFPTSEAIYQESLGRWSEAEKSIRKAIDDLSRNSDFNFRGNVSLATRQIGNRDEMLADQIWLATILLRQGQLIQAEQQVRAVINPLLEAHGKQHRSTASAIATLGAIMEAQGRPEAAEALAVAALKTLDEMKVPPGARIRTNFQLNLARALLAQRKWDAAGQIVAAMQADMSTGEAPFDALYGRDSAIAMALIMAGDAAKAAKLLDAAAGYYQARFPKDSDVIAMSVGLLAVARSRSGDRAGAALAFAQAMPAILATAVNGEKREHGLRTIEYELIVEEYMFFQSQGSPDTQGDLGFTVSEAVRGREVQTALASAAARGLTADPAMGDLIRQEQDATGALQAIDDHLTTILAAAESQRPAGLLEKLLSDRSRLVQAQAVLREEIGRRFPQYANLINPKPPAVAQVQAALADDEALIATYVGETRSFVWAVPKRGAVAFAVAPVTRRELAASVAKLRGAIDFKGSTLADVSEFDVAEAYRLYALFLKPVEAGWQGAKNLLVVSHGPLGQLPLALLPTASTALMPQKDGEALFANYGRVPWLARETAITQLPSVASFTILRGALRPPIERRPFVGFGDPWFSAQQGTEGGTQVAVLPSGETATRGGRSIRFRNASGTATLASAELAGLPRLPETAGELREIARALKADPDKDVFVGPAANERTVKTMVLADRRVIAFATHGLVAGDLNGLSQPALALSSPQVSGAPGDGLLTMDEVLGLKLNADWVVLSACNTAAGDGAGVEAVSGIGRAFFYAGARALLVSNWAVETTSARELTTELFRRQAQDGALTRAEALRQSEIALIDGEGFVDPSTHKAVFSYAHPIFWAPFSLVGDGGR